MIYNDYLVGEARENAIADFEISNEYKKLMNMYELANIQLDTYKMDAELKVFKESGTYDDLEMLFSEAEAQVQDDKTSILARIFQWFANMFQKIHDAVARVLKGNIDPNAEYTVNMEQKDAENMSIIQKAINALNPLGDDGTWDVKKLIEEIGISGLAIGSVVAVKMKGSELTQKLNEATGAVDKFNGFINKAKGWVDRNLPFADKIKGALDQIVKPASDFLNNRVKAISSAVGTAVNTVQDTAGIVKDTLTGIDQEDGRLILTFKKDGTFVKAVDKNTGADANPSKSQINRVRKALEKAGKINATKAADANAANTTTQESADDVLLWNISDDGFDYTIEETDDLFVVTVTESREVQLEEKWNNIFGDIVAEEAPLSEEDELKVLFNTI